MPLYTRITADKNTEVLIWKIEESEEILHQNIQLTHHCRERISNMKSAIHRRGFLSVRQLLKVAGYSASQLFYDEEGRPHLSDGKEISITHSFIFSALIISDIKVGIDIEKQRPKIKLIAPKFVGDEFDFIEKIDAIRMLTSIWCAKESLYKAFATAGISFKKHIKISSFHQDDSTTSASVFFENIRAEYIVFFLEFEGYGCAYALKN